MMLTHVCKWLCGSSANLYIDAATGTAATATARDYAGYGPSPIPAAATRSVAK